ncbi:aminotransferase class V-fold PLP-dependent enzyme [Diplocloster modestus]|uniref:Aminotransferase class V-fold PLP-dependent enzyme n=1 Tax=Diplocloster modestus TaxID=2850322 RepID=A0ABS6KB48_9FIRM|nr:aminotransferase class V-fold PLP-dependent enzyme [Diplocloster modestus]MBU9727707.1 aminotransferase class V-fold PLP-dependent enzyme [Diplocloster modestus]
MIYLNHAATSYPRLPEVKEAVLNCMDRLPSSEYRSNAAGDVSLAPACREKLGRLFHIKDYERILFTSGATEAANLIINGLPLEGKTVLTAADAHNCILRPLYNSDKHPVLKKIPLHASGELDLDLLEEELRKGAYALFVNHCSNVTGMLTDIGAVCALAEKYCTLVFVDISQSAGCIPIDMDQWRADGLIFTAHKSLLGIQGLGGFYMRKTGLLRPVKFGGTGKDSHILKFPDGHGAAFEVGTQNEPAIAALDASLQVLLRITPEVIQRQEEEMMRYMADQLRNLKPITLYGDTSKPKGPVLSMRIRGLSVSDIGYILENGYGIIVRTGLHCAPLIHEDLGTAGEGTVRISISFLTKWEEINALVEAVREIAGSCGT